MKPFDFKGAGIVLWTAVLTAAIILGGVRVSAFVQTILLERQEEKLRNQTAVSNFSYEMTSYCWNGETLIVDGTFCNKNTDRHLSQVDMMFITVADMQGREIGSHIMDDLTAKTLRIPPESEVPYRFEVYPHPKLDPDFHQDLCHGIQLSFMSSIGTKECAGAHCAWCHSPQTDHQTQIRKAMSLS